MTGSPFSQPASAGPLLSLSHDAWECVVAPACGARIVSLKFKDCDVLRPASADALAEGSVYGFAGFVLMPYSGPIFSTGFAFAGNDYPLARTVREEPTATHGEGWIRPWRILRQDASSVTLELDHVPEPGTFPFVWRGQLYYNVGPQGLSVDIRLVNRDHRSMPAGIGFHPYFPKPPGTRLEFEALGVWPPDAPEAARMSCGPVPPGLDFAHGADVSAIVLDRCYEGWSGTARIVAPDGFAATLTGSGALKRMQVYSAWDQPYVCLEPVSNANDGFNRMALDVPGHGVAVLAPGETLSGGFTITANS